MSDMAKAVFRDDPASSTVFKDLHDVLNRFAHQDTLGFARKFKGQDGDTAAIQLGSDPDPHYLEVAAYFFLLISALSVDAIARWIGGSPSMWSRHVALFASDVDAWLRLTEARQGDRLRSLGLLPDEASQP